MYYSNNELPPQRGWICPKCGRVNAPWKPSCDCVSTQTTGTGTAYLVKTSSVSQDSHEIAEQREYPTEWCEKCELWREDNCVGVAQCKRNIQILTEAYKAEQTEPSLEQFRVGLEYHTDATHFGKAKGESTTTNTADTPQTERIKTPDYCDICNHKGCDNCTANNLDDYCVPSGYAPKDTPQTDAEITELAKEIVHKMIDDAVIAEDAYPDLRQKMHEAVERLDEYYPSEDERIE